MMVVVSYDVSTLDKAGERRLRQIAKLCQDFGQRVQCSVFEIELQPAQWTLLRHSLCEVIDPSSDSLRFYHLGKNWEQRVEHVGAKPTLNLNGPLIF